MCGAALGTRGDALAMAERRRIFIDLRDLDLTGYLASPALRASVVANVYERFAPFADDAWEWIAHPGDATFDGWVYDTLDGELRIVGVQLECRRLHRSLWRTAPPAHHLSEYRTHQLTATPWTATVGSKRWADLHR
jgi:hypothetical protein